MRIQVLLLAFLAAPLARAADQAPAAAPAPPHITLSWSTASEMDNYGFFVMRADEEKGPFKALNEKLLPGGGNSDVPLEYKYVDEKVVMGKTYFYFLESVSTSGVHEKFSPTLKKLCCKQPGASAPAADAKGDPKKKDAAEPARTPAAPAKKG